MNIVNSGSTYQVYGEGLHTFKQLPAASYEVCFHKMKGFFLQSRPNLESKEGKIYGDHERRVAKVLDAFEIANRNLGIILSGEKGIGKSLFARVLAEQAMEKP
jgi:transcriptional regulator with GAF, ATPase, and Fis domain